MELVNVSDENVTNVAFRNMESNAAQVDDFNPKVDDLFSKVDEVCICTIPLGLKLVSVPPTTPY